MMHANKVLVIFSIDGLPKTKDIEKSGSGIIMAQYVLINIKLSFQENCDIKWPLCYWRSFNNYINYNKAANEVAINQL